MTATLPHCRSRLVPADTWVRCRGGPLPAETPRLARGVLEDRGSAIHSPAQRRSTRPLSCPGNNLTGGKRRSGRPTKGNRWLGEVLTECAWAAARSRVSYLPAQFWRLARRIGKKKAAMPWATPSC